jgi:hypothetical protein
MIVWRAAMGRLLPFYELEDRFPTERSALAAAYAQSYSFVSWIERAYGVDAIIDMARAVNEDTSLDLAMVHATGKPTAALHDAWREHLVHGSGAAWRAAFAEFFSLSLVLLVVQAVPDVDWKQEGFVVPPESAFHCPCVTSVCPRKKLRERVTLCSVSSGSRPTSVETEPMVKVPAGM